MVKLIALVKRKPELKREEFARRWLEQHIAYTWRLPGLREYRINIATEQQPAGAPDFDGSAELWWDSLEALEAAFATPEGIAGGADADEFCAVRLHLYTDEHQIANPHAAG